MKEKNIILILEDEIPLQKAISSKLIKAGFEFLASRTVKGGLLHLKQNNFIKAIWLDHYLLGAEDGLDFVKKVKENKKFKNLPIIVVSNTASPSKLKTYIGLGVDKYFIKAESKLEDIIADLKNIINK